MKKNLLLAFMALAAWWPAGAAGQTTPVVFPLNSMFGGAAYGKTITLTPANTLITDGQNIWAGTYQNVLWPGTNPVVRLYPNTYLITVPGVVKAARFSVYASDGTNLVNAGSRITSGPLFYFGTNGMANLIPSSNITFTTNADGSISISSAGGGGGINYYFGGVTNQPVGTLWTNGNNVFSGTNTAALYDASNPLLFQTAADATTNAQNVVRTNIPPLAQVANGLNGTLSPTNLPTTSVTLNGTFSGNGNALTNLNGAKVVGSLTNNTTGNAGSVNNGRGANVLFSDLRIGYGNGDPAGAGSLVVGDGGSVAGTWSFGGGDMPVIPSPVTSSFAFGNEARADASYAFSLGHFPDALHQYAFVICLDDTKVDWVSTTNNQFRLWAPNGIELCGSPVYALDSGFTNLFGQTLATRFGLKTDQTDFVAFTNNVIAVAPTNILVLNGKTPTAGQYFAATGATNAEGAWIVMPTNPPASGGGALTNYIYGGYYYAGNYTSNSDNFLFPGAVQFTERGSAPAAFQTIDECNIKEVSGVFTKAFSAGTNAVWTITNLTSAAAASWTATGTTWTSGQINLSCSKYDQVSLYFHQNGDPQSFNYVALKIKTVAK